MSDDRVSLPNALGVVRLLVSPALLPLGGSGDRTLFLLVYLGLAATDWLDGLLARAVAGETAFGARLDTVADAVMYGCLVIGLARLVGGPFVAEWPWMTAAAGSYAVSWAVSLSLRGRPPVHHAWMARGAAVLVFATVLVLLLAGRVWPVRVAAAVVTLANLQSAGLTLLARGDGRR